MGPWAQSSGEAEAAVQAELVLLVRELVEVRTEAPGEAVGESRGEEVPDWGASAVTTHKEPYPAVLVQSGLPLG